MMIVNLEGKENPFASCENLATAITEILKEKEDCTPLDLKAKGFSSNEIKRNWQIAYALAKVNLL